MRETSHSKFSFVVIEDHKRLYALHLFRKLTFHSSFFWRRNLIFSNKAAIYRSFWNIVPNFSCDRKIFADRIRLLFQNHRESCTRRQGCHMHALLNLLLQFLLLYWEPADEIRLLFWNYRESDTHCQRHHMCLLLNICFQSLLRYEEPVDENRLLSVRNHSESDRICQGWRKPPFESLCFYFLLRYLEPADDIWLLL